MDIEDVVELLLVRIEELAREAANIARERDTYQQERHRYKSRLDTAITRLEAKGGLDDIISLLKEGK